MEPIRAFFHNFSDVQIFIRQNLGDVSLYSPSFIDGIKNTYYKLLNEQVLCKAGPDLIRLEETSSGIEMYKVCVYHVGICTSINYKFIDDEFIKTCMWCTAYADGGGFEDEDDYNLFVIENDFVQDETRLYYKSCELVKKLPLIDKPADQIFDDPTIGDLIDKYLLLM